MIVIASVQLEKANAAEEEAVSLRRMAEEGFLEMKKQVIH